MIQTASPSVTTSQQATILGHPKGLVILFMTEMWERFSYYGMRALLILYLTQHFLFTDEASGIIYGAYTALVYVMTIIGGTLADRYLGSRKAVTFGAILLVLGHFGMAFEGSGSRQIMTYNGGEYVLGLDGRGGDATQIVTSAQGSSPITFSDGAML
ncbi:MAG: MFS transporter, partial [Pseudomonadota bacterium]|nr:MFS transporter [Pseudomonadota bacterium]